MINNYKTFSSVEIQNSTKLIHDMKCAPFKMNENIFWITTDKSSNFSIQQVELNNFSVKGTLFDFNLEFTDHIQDTAFTVGQLIFLLNFSKKS